MDKKTENKRYKNLSRTVNEMLDILPETDKDLVKITVINNDDVLIENFGRVYEYTDSCVAFFNKNLLVKIEGSSLKIKGLSSLAIRVTGIVYSITYKEDGV